MANLTCAITNGCATFKPILVADAADAHRKANPTPAAIHLYCLLMLSLFNLPNIKTQHLRLRKTFYRDFKISQITLL